MLTTEQIEQRRQQVASVPCGGCTACCKQDRILLNPRKDDLRTLRWHREDRFAVLDRKPDGSCVYLTESGCSIHDRAPDICQRFDCRVLVLMTPPAKRVIRIAQNPTMRDVYAAGERRMNTLNGPEA